MIPNPLATFPLTVMSNSSDVGPSQVVLNGEVISKPTTMEAYFGICIIGPNTQGQPSVLYDQVYNANISTAYEQMEKDVNATINNSGSKFPVIVFYTYGLDMGTWSYKKEMTAFIESIGGGNVYKDINQRVTYLASGSFKAISYCMVSSYNPETKEIAHSFDEAGELGYSATTLLTLSLQKRTYNSNTVFDPVDFDPHFV